MSELEVIGIDTSLLKSENEPEEIVPAPLQMPVNPKFRGLIMALEEKLKSLPNAIDGSDFPLRHSFAEGVYMREMIAPKGLLIITELHRYSYISYVLRGDVTVLTEDGLRRFTAPCSIISPAGTKRIAYTHEDLLWVTVHPNPSNDMDIDRLEKEIHVEGGYPNMPNEVIETDDVDKVYNNFIELAHQEEK